MRSILTLTFLIICFSAFGQINFNLYGYDPCSKEVRRIDFFGLKKDGIAFNTQDTTGVLILKDTGTYVLSYVIGKIDSTELGKKFDVKSIENFSDTLRLIRVSSCLEPTSHPNFIGYCCCDQKCEGTQIDYYENGNKRVEGFFKEGIPIGKLKFYYPDGKLRTVKKYSKKGKLIKTYTY
ncbi:MAG: toxin-antitoxin system YwqK family antitoxin [Cyclobacteriaceae bacterium]